MAKTIKWGILGLGRIADKFAQDIQLIQGAELFAVASNSKERAELFASKYKAPHFYGSYKELVVHPEIDVVYIATRHPQHVENSLLALSHGKNVLCEKPMAMNAADAKVVLQLAKERNLFFMEAIWTRFFPITQILLDKQRGLIGEIQSIHADFGFKADVSVKRLFDKKMGGGSLLDIGIYPIFLSLLLKGKPEQVNAQAIFTDSGVDASCKMLLQYENALANLSSTIIANTPTEAWILGELGSFKMESRFHEPTILKFYKQSELIETWTEEKFGHGYTYEIAHVNECIQNGWVESPHLPHQLSFDLMQIIDNVRKEIALVY